MKFLYIFTLLGVIIGLISCQPTLRLYESDDSGEPVILALDNLQQTVIPSPNSLEKWSARDTHQVVVFDDGSGEALFLLGGHGSSNLNDVWRSPYGIRWEEITTNSPIWAARRDHQVVVFKEAMYVIGGYGGSYLNDVWTSTDGSSWTQVTADAPWSKRSQHQVVAYEGAMYLMGGYNGGFLNDVWKSTDGSSWTQVTTSTPIWSGRSSHEVVAYEGAMYLTGGWNGGPLNDVYKSTDGSSWTQVITNTNAPWDRRRDHQVVVFDDGAGEALFLLGGFNGGSRFNDVWKSTNGSSWTQVTANAPWSERRDHQVLVLGEALYLMGGHAGGSQLNDVWTSTDGSSWEDIDDYLMTEPLGLALDENEDIYLLGTNTNQVIVLKKASSGTAFLAEFSGTTTETITDSAVFSRNNRIYIVGGKLDGAQSNSIYAYDTLSKGFQNTGLTLPQAVFGHHLQVLNDCVYLLNGTNNSLAPVNYKNCDSSLGSTSWVELTSVNDADITNFASLVFGSGIYLVGGQDPQNNALNATYFLGADDDELTAIPKNDPYGLTSSYGSTGIAVSGTFLLLGGQDAAGALNADVYQSVDGGGQWSTINSLSLETVKNFVVQKPTEPLTLYVYGQRQSSLEGDIFYTIGLQEE